MSTPRIDPVEAAKEKARKEEEQKKRTADQEAWARYAYTLAGTAYGQWRRIDIIGSPDPRASASLSGNALPPGKTLNGKYEKTLEDQSIIRISIENGKISLLSPPKDLPEFQKSYAEVIKTLAIEMGSTTITIDWPGQVLDPGNSDDRDIVLDRLELLLAEAEKYQVRVELGTFTWKMLEQCDSSIFEGVGYTSQKQRADAIRTKIKTLDAVHGQALHTGKYIEHRREIEVEKLIEKLGQATEKLTEAEKALDSALNPKLPAVFDFKQVKTQMANVEKAANELTAQMDAVSKNVNDVGDNMGVKFWEGYQARFMEIKAKEAMQSAVDGLVQLRTNPGVDAGLREEIEEQKKKTPQQEGPDWKINWDKELLRKKEEFGKSVETANNEFKAPSEAAEKGIAVKKTAAEDKQRQADEEAEQRRILGH